MALVTAAAVGRKTDQIRSAFNAVLNEGSAVRSRVQSQIDLLKAREKEFLSLFGSEVKTFQDLNAKLIQVKNEALAIENFSGENLEKEFLREAKTYMTITGQNMKNKNSSTYQKKQISLFLERIGRRAVMGADGKRDEVAAILNSFGPDIANEVMNSLGRGGAIRTGVLTPSQISRIKKILLDGAKEEAMKEVINFNSQWESQGGIKGYLNLAQIQEGDNSLVVSIDQKILNNVASATQGLTETEAKEKAKNDPAFLANVQARFKDVLKTKMPGNPIFSEAVDHVVNSAGYRIFFGNNYLKGYTGLLGEIAGVYYLKSLFSGNPSIAVQWTGGLRASGRDPHEDIKVFTDKLGYNIQVKNTRRSTSFLSKNGNEVFFSNRIMTPEEFSQMDSFKGISYGSGGALGDDLPGLISELYEMLGFNIEVNVSEKGADKGKWVPMANEEFAPLRGRIETLYDEAEKVIQMAAAILMHMSIEQEASAGNIAFLVGGSSFYSASEILTDAISNSSNFKVQFYANNGGTDTIADYYNKNRYNPGEKLPNSFYDRGELAVRMRSSYNFH